MARLFARARESWHRQWRRFGIAFLGIQPKAYERYGNHGVIGTWMTNAILLPAVTGFWVLTNASSYAAFNQREAAMDAVEMNRKRFYGREAFGQELNEATQSALYSHVHGYVSIDTVTGIKKTTDGKYVGPKMDEIEGRLKHIPVTDEMLSMARQLHQEKLELAKKHELPGNNASVS